MNINIRLIITAFILSIGLFPTAFYAESYGECLNTKTEEECKAVPSEVALVEDDETPFLKQRGDINLLQPLDDKTTTLRPEPGIGIFFTYFNLSWPWAIGSAAGIAVLQALIGGIQMMLSGGDSGKREEGKNKIMWALAGLLMVGLSGMILETINPLFFVQS